MADLAGRDVGRGARVVGPLCRNGRLCVDPLRVVEPRATVGDAVEALFGQHPQAVARGRRRAVGEIYDAVR